MGDSLTQEFKDMLCQYKSDVHHECLLIDDFVADPAAILQYVAELEAIRDKVDGYAACAPDYAYELQAVADAEAAEFEREYLEMTGGMP